jgi:hypothetical protein
MIAFCVKLCTGCTSTGKAKIDETVAFVLKEAYAHGGKTAVSNRIEQLVVDGKITADQALILHATAEKIYQDVITHLDGNTSTTNTVLSVE